MFDSSTTREPAATALTKRNEPQAVKSMDGVKECSTVYQRMVMSALSGE